MHEDDDITQAAATDRDKGAALIRRLARTLPDAPGVYRMLDARGEILYIGKARSLRKRVLNYTNPAKLPVRLQRMIALTLDMIFVHTHTEVEALLLEANLIKKHKPRFNILLRDDKSFPYILLTGDHDFPLLTKHRGARKPAGDYYGPFASGQAVNDTLNTLQKAFMLRNCADTVFAQRQRPCLQYHIKRCTAPCVGLVSKEEYARQADDARAFLSGRSRDVQARLTESMQDASARMEYEEAARIRDRIRALTSIQAHQDINIEGIGDADVIALSRQEGRSCVQVFFFRAGQNFGNRPYFPRHVPEESSEDILGAFLAQFYENKPLPVEIIVGQAVTDKALLEEAFAARAGGKVTIMIPQRGARKRMLDFVMQNARTALEQESLRQAGEKKLLEGVAALFGLADAPQRIEVYDNSHISGTNMVGAMIVAGPDGFMKNAYRKFNIRDAEASDDYGMMREVIGRRFSRTLREDKGPGAPDWPDLLLIDGGQGQLNAVRDVLAEIGLSEDVTIVAIAKGPDRNAGRETFFMPERVPFTLPPDDPVLHYLQRLRDEVHRFAIGTHRARRVKQISQSLLDDVPGIGARRKKALLLHFGSAQDVARAGITDLMAVEGISEAFARRIYEFFHESL